MTVICPDLAPPKRSQLSGRPRTSAPQTIWTQARTKQLVALIDQCGANLCRTIIAIDLGISGGARERIVAKKLRELKMKGTPLS
jgi:hypothetical protein